MGLPILTYASLRLMPEGRRTKSFALFDKANSIERRGRKATDLVDVGLQRQCPILYSPSPKRQVYHPWCREACELWLLHFRKWLKKRRGL
jgi:hypothetical protein